MIIYGFRIEGTENETFDDSRVGRESAKKSSTPFFGRGQETSDSNKRDD